MTAKNIERLLEQTLLHDGAMQYGLYEYELKSWWTNSPHRSPKIKMNTFLQ